MVGRVTRRVEAQASQGIEPVCLKLRLSPRQLGRCLGYRGHEYADRRPQLDPPRRSPTLCNCCAAACEIPDCTQRGEGRTDLTQLLLCDDAVRARIHLPPRAAVHLPPRTATTGTGSGCARSARSGRCLARPPLEGAGSSRDASGGAALGARPAGGGGRDGGGGGGGVRARRDASSATGTRGPGRADPVQFLLGGG